MPALVTSIPAIFTIPPVRLPTVIPVARSSLAGIGMTSRHGIFRQTDVARNVGRAAKVFFETDAGRWGPRRQPVRLRGSEPELSANENPRRRACSIKE